MNPMLHTSSEHTDRVSRECAEFFMPEELTPLAFTPTYRSLSEAQRRRYNQLHGFYFLEQTVFFEQQMGRPSLERLLEIAPTPDLRNVITHFIEEENRHTEWFWELLRDCEPDWYRDRRFHFVRAGPLTAAVFRFAVSRPRLFPCFLWLQIITEERVQHFSISFIKNAAVLDSRFVDVQGRHLVDEGGHIRWDAELIEWIWPATSSWLRKVNGRMLEWLLREFFHLPKRSGWNVVERLIAEFPELVQRRAELRAAMDNLAYDQSYLRTLYPRSVLSRTRRLAGKWPELGFLEQFFTD